MHLTDNREIRNVYSDHNLFFLPSLSRLLLLLVNVIATQNEYNKYTGTNLFIHAGRYLPP